jgi:GNAT superfamily N-acetyltransferase
VGTGAAGGGGGVAIRRVGEGDAEALAGLHVRAWQWAYRGHLPDAYLDGLGQQLAEREAMWRRLLQHPGPGQAVWVAEQAGRVVGFCSTGPGGAGAAEQGGQAEQAELHTIYVEPAVVGAGVGAALMRQALAELRGRRVRTVILWVLDTNARARRFYERGGWRTDGGVRTEEIWGARVREVRYRIALDDPGGRQPPSAGSGRRHAPWSRVAA